MGSTRSARCAGCVRTERRVMPLTLEQIEAIEEENEIAEVIREEEEMLEMEIQGRWIPPMPEDGEETDDRESILR